MVDFGDDRPSDLVRQVHDAYFEAGATVATTNTYAVLRDRLARLADIADKVEELTEVAVSKARQSCEDHGSGRVADRLAR